MMNETRPYDTGTGLAGRSPLNRDPVAPTFGDPTPGHGIPPGDPLFVLTSAGNLDSEIRISGGNQLFPARHTERDTVRDSTGVNFSKQYDQTPKITFVAQSGISYASTNKVGVSSTANQRIDMAALNPDVSGFTQRAKVIAGKTITSIDDGFSSTQNTGAPEDSSGVSMTSNGDVVFSNLEDANTDQATYKAWFTALVTLASSDKWTVELYHNDGSTSTTWTEVDSRQFNGSASTTFNLSFAGTLGSSWDLRGRVTWDNFTVLDAGQSFDVTAHGETGTTSSTQPGVQFDRDDGNTEFSMTPDSDDKIAYTAQEAQI